MRLLKVTRLIEDDKTAERPKMKMFLLLRTEETESTIMIAQL